MGDRFSCVSGPAGCPARPGDREWDLTGRWLVPGLIDTHVHLRFDRDSQLPVREQRLRFALGITTTRDAGSPTTEILLAGKAGYADGRSAVPRLVVAASITPEHAREQGVTSSRALVRHWASLGVDAIKIRAPRSDNEWRDAIRAAREAGLPVFGHTGNGLGEVFSQAAIVEGISGISHLMWFSQEAQRRDDPGSSRDTIADPWVRGLFRWVAVDATQLDTIGALMRAKGTWLEPTLAVEYHAGRPLRPPGHLRFLDHPRGIRAHLRASVRWPQPVEGTPGPRYPEPWFFQARFVGDFIRRGGTVITGADHMRPGLGLHEEMRLVGEVAGSPMAGLVAATRDAAHALGRADLGTIEAGRLADAVVLAADPITTPGATLMGVHVIKGGIIHDVATLLEPFREEHRARVRAAWRGRLARAGLAAAGALVLAAILRALLARMRREAR